MTSPVHHYLRLVILILNKQAVGLLPAGDGISGQELGRPDNTVEDQAEPLALEGCSPMSLGGAVEEVALVPGVDGDVTVSLFDTESASCEVAEANSVRLPLVALVPVRG